MALLLSVTVGHVVLLVPAALEDPVSCMHADEEHHSRNDLEYDVLLRAVMQELRGPSVPPGFNRIEHWGLLR